MIRLNGLLGRSACPPAASNKGSILIISLWSLCLLAVFAVTLGYGVRQKIALVAKLDERSQLSLIADAGVRKAIAELRKEEERTYDSLNDLWSNNQAAFCDVSLGAGAFSVCYDYRDEDAQIPQIRYGLIDEERKININKMHKDVIERLFRVGLGLEEIQAQDLAASIVDWRDSDSELSVPVGSAEGIYYRNLTYPYEAKDAEFEVLDELLLVKGMTQGLFEIIRDYVTIYGSGKVNVNTASASALLALGLNDGIVDKIIKFRRGKDNAPGTADDDFFDTPASIVAKLSQAFELSDSDVAQLSIIREQYLVTRSENFMIKSVAKLINRKISIEAYSAVKRESGKILYWQEYYKF